MPEFPGQSRSRNELNNLRQDCLYLITHKLSSTAEWRLTQARKFRDDARNGLAAKKLADLAAEADELPGDVWNELAQHYHWSSEKFAEAVSQTNRSVGFRHATPDLESYWRSLVANVRSAFEVN